MKPLFTLIVGIFFTIPVCVSSPNLSYADWSATQSSTKSVLISSASQKSPDQSASAAVNPLDEEYTDDASLDEYADKSTQEERVEIADPLESVNRVTHQFNDKLYFWAMKPVAQGYKAVVPEPARISVKHFFSNLGFPARFLSCLLQTDLSGAATEAGRFTINTLWGIGGFLDPSSGTELNLQEQDTDLGQTLGVWGIGQGFYIVWPVFGPSTPRDTVSMAGDYFLYPVSYVNPQYARWGMKAYDKINSVSLRIGDYEALKDAAVDPYVAFRDAYAQYRYKRVKARKAKMFSSSAPANPESSKRGK
jgi:phospholipid-binding lipoprotein MlaA